MIRIGIQNPMGCLAGKFQKVTYLTISILEINRLFLVPRVTQSTNFINIDPQLFEQSLLMSKNQCVPKLEKNDPESRAE